MVQPTNEISLLAALDAILAAMSCSVGTVHVLSSSSGLLELRAHRGMPEALLDRVALVPIGKGMAGLAAERREAVQVCNLQTDSSGVAKPNARQSGSRGSIAVPILHGEALHGVLGIGRNDEHEFTSEEQSALLRIAAALAPHVQRA